MIMLFAVIIFERQPSVRIGEASRDSVRNVSPGRNVKDEKHLMPQISLILRREDPVNLIGIRTRSAVR
jgi:hypothetical protein